MIPPSLAISAATSAYGLISSVVQNATSSGSNGTNGTSGSSGSSGTSGTSGTTTGKGRENEVVNQAEFMKLLIAQLSNQDPLNPLDSANFSAQLAQFSSLEQLTQINDKLAALGGDKIGKFDAVSFIGREVTGPSAGIAVKDGVATTLDYTLERGDPVVAKVIDESGKQVATFKIEGEGAGKHTLDLAKISGAPKLTDGTYAVVLSQADPAGGSPDQIDTFVTGKVTGVDLTGSKPTLYLGDRKLLLEDVTEIKEASADTGL